MNVTNPHSDNPLEPWVKLSVLRWFRVEDYQRGVDVQIREVIEVHRDGDLEFHGYGPVLKVNGQRSMREARFVWLSPHWIKPEIISELARRRALLEAHHGRKSPLRSLPAAAIPVGATVNLEAGPVRIAKAQYGTPTSGRITWTDENGRDWEVDAASKVEVISLP